MNSTSALGSTQITLQFDLSRDIDAAALDVQTAISSALRQLPPNMPSPPSFRKVNPADAPILYLTLQSDVLPLYDVDEYAETFLAQRISMISGVAQVVVFGSQKEPFVSKSTPISWLCVASALMKSKAPSAPIMSICPPVLCTAHTRLLQLKAPASFFTPPTLHQLLSLIGGRSHPTARTWPCH